MLQKASTPLTLMTKNVFFNRLYTCLFHMWQSEELFRCHEAQQMKHIFKCLQRK